MVMQGGCVRKIGGDGPCGCICHNHPTGMVKHVMPCCKYSGMSHEDAAAQKYRDGSQPSVLTRKGVPLNK